MKSIYLRKLTIRFTYLLLVLGYACFSPLYGQLVVTAGGTASALANAIIGSGVTVSNAVLNCPTGAFGSFTATNTNLGMNGGILLTTGSVANAVGPNNSPSTGLDNTGANNTFDPNLGTGLYDPCILEFDLVSQCSTLSLRYVFGSEEYMEWVGLNFNDEFGFFVSGPNPAGGNYVGQNIAVIPGTSIAVSIDNVNANVNPTYYTSNTGGATLQYDGLTQDPNNSSLTATIAVIPCSTYHMKLIIADRGDGIFDSGVFLQQGGFNCPNSQLMAVTPSSTPSSCSGNTGTASIVVNSGIGPFTYSWSTGQTGVTSISNLAPGTYTVTVNDQSACTQAVTQSITVGGGGNVSGSILSQGNVSCNGGNNGFVTLNATSGTAPFTYNINGGAFGGTSTFSNLTAGTYTFQIKDQTGCVFTLNATITQPSALGAVANVINQVNCNGGNNGSASVTPSGGSGAYTYSWSNGQTSATATNLTAGTYTIFVFDAAALTCSTSATVTITQPTALSAVANQITPVNCNGSSNGVATVVGSGGSGVYTYSWVTSPVQTTATATNLAAGTYTVFVADANVPNAMTVCRTSTTVTITQPNPLAIVPVSQTNVNCFGGNTGQAVMAAGGGSGVYNYSWTTTPVQNTSTATNLTAGTYTFYVFDANAISCSTSMPITITQVPALTATTNVLNQVLCAGAATGSATVVAGGGSGAYTYSWITTPPQLTATATGLAAGTYNVTVTDLNATNCFISASATITQPTALGAVTNVINHVNCNGGNNGSASVTPSGGSGTYTYSWSNGQTTATATNLVAGTYTAFVFDAAALTCSTSATVTITQPAAITAVANQITAVNCNGANNGVANVVGGGGFGTYTYSWLTSPVQTTAIATNLTAGTYTVFVEDATVAGCNASTTVTITEPAALAIQTVSLTHVNCFGGNTGQAVMSATGGSGAYNYSWNTTPAQLTSTASNLIAGTYTLFVNDANATACSTSMPITITQVPALTASSNVINQVKCFGDSTGIATVVAGGGSGTYTYSWVTTPPQLTATATNLPAGTYTVVVADANATNCFISTVATITQPPALAGNPPLITGVTCFGGNNGTALVAPNGGSGNYTYSWSNGQTTANATNLSAGTYTVVIADLLDPACTITQTANISQPPALAIATNISNVTCNNGTNGQIIATGSGGFGTYQYSWTTTPAVLNATLSNLSAGTYTVFVMDDSVTSCMASATVSVTEPTILAISLANASNVTCYAGTNGAIDINVSGGSGMYNYAWNTTPVQVSQDLNNLAAGTYSVILQDANDTLCSTSFTHTITEPDSLNLSNTSMQPVSCFGFSDGQASVTPTGGSGAYLYNWNSVPAQTTATATNLPANTYTVIVTDANDPNCSANTSVTVTQPTQMQLNNVNISNVTCFGGNNGFIDVDVLGSTSNYTYSWVNGTGATVGTNPAFPDSVINLTAGTYTVYIADATNTNCFISFPNLVGQPAALSINNGLINNVTCNGGNNGTATVSGAGGSGAYNYSWLTTPVQISSTAGGLSAGTYTVYVIDANDANCMTSTTVNITQPAALTLAMAQTNVTCNGGTNGTAMVTANGGSGNYQYNWSTVPPQTAATAINLAANTYTVFVNDSLDINCSASTTVTITQPAPLVTTPSIVTPISCFGLSNGVATVTPSGGSGMYAYSWVLPSGVQTTQTVNGLPAGIYEIYIIDLVDFNCIDSAQITLTQPADILVNTVSVSDVLCNGANTGTAQVAAQGGGGSYTYTWDTNPAQYGATGTNLFAGTYTITVDDGNCTKTHNLAVTQPPALTISSSSSGLNCNGDVNATATVIVTGGTLPYTFSWATNPLQASFTATGLAAGDYPFYLIDANGCKTYTIQSIIDPPALNLTQSQTNVRCYGNSSGSATVNVTGGTPPYLYAWTGGVSTTATATGLFAGNYTVVVTDAKGCQISTSYTIIQPFEPIDIVLNADSVSCFGSNDGTASVVAFGGTPPYTYTWNTNPQQFGTTAINLISKTYTVIVKDANNCTYNKSIYVPSPLRIKTTVLDKNDAFCNLANGSIQVGSINGNAPYTYSWTPVEGNNALLANIPEGQYEVFVTDVKGCKDSLTTQIGNMPPPIAAFESTPAATDVIFLNNANIGFINQSTGNIASYLWNFGDGNVATTKNTSHTFIDSGSYVVMLIAFDPHNACPDTAMATYHITPNGDIFVPNAFTPNDDGKNDYFFVSGNGVTAMTCLLYDRWGKEITKLTQLYETWNGTDRNGKSVPEGTYIYKINATLNDGRSLVRGGSVMIIR
ncbi:MAG: choice-of-anchor L domain-containing protein [Bacteroidia bacterium]